MLRFPVSRSTRRVHPWFEDLFTGNVSSNRPKDSEEPGDGMGALLAECKMLSDENQVLKRCLHLLKENTALETRTLLSAVVAFSDDQFRRKFANGIEGLIHAEENLPKGEVESSVPDISHQKTQTSKVFYTSAATGFSEHTLPAEAFQENEDTALASSEEEEPVRDVPTSEEEAQREFQQEDLIHEVPERDVPMKKPRRRYRPKPLCPRICPKSPNVSLGGRQVKSAENNPYFYPSEPTSKHLQSHMQTRTAFTSDLEYDALYLRSLVLAAGFRALSKGLRMSTATAAEVDAALKPYKYVSLDKLCRHVSGIPPYIMYKHNKRLKPARLIHTCVCPKPTRLYPFSREGYSHTSAPGRKASDKGGKLNMKPLKYLTDERAKSSPLAQPLEVKSPKKAKKKSKKIEKDDDYDFQAVVTPIIDQARQSLNQVTGAEPAPEQLTSFSLQHTHKEYQYKDDGTAVVQSDVYKKSYNWSSDEEGGKGEKPAEEGGEVQEVIEVAQGGPEEAGTTPPVTDSSNVTSNDQSANNKTNNYPSTKGDRRATPQWLEDNRDAVSHDMGLVFSRTTNRDKLSSDAVSRDRGIVSKAVSHDRDLVSKTVSRTMDLDSKVVSRDKHLVSSAKNRNRYLVNETVNRDNNLVSEAVTRDKHVVSEAGSRNRDLVSEAVSRDKHLASKAVNHDRDWANHCSVTSPVQMVTPRMSTYGPSHDLLRDSDNHLPTMNLGKEKDRNGQPRCSSPKSRSSSGSKEADSSSVVARWVPSPRLDYFPVTQASSSQHDQSRWVAAVPRVRPKNLLGEVAFQLERRILDYVFTNSLSDLNIGPAPSFQSTNPDRRRRFLGCSISNIGEMISQEALAGERYSRGTERMLRERLRTMLDLLTPMGYDLLEHGAFSKDIIEKYGMLSANHAKELGKRQSGKGNDVGLPGLSVVDVQNFIFTASETTEERDALLLIFDCLRMLAIEDGKPLFVW